MSEYTEHEENADQAHGEGSFGLSDRFHERARIRGGIPRRVLTSYKIQIPEEVDHFREERKQTDYGLESEEEYAKRLAKRQFLEDYGTSPGFRAEIHVEDYRETGVRPSDGFRSAFTVRIDTRPDWEHEYPEPEPESDIFLEDDDD